MLRRSGVLIWLAVLCALPQVLAAQEEMWNLGGEWPAGDSRKWEPVSSVRARVRPVLEQYLHLSNVVVVCHDIVIFSLTDVRTEFAQMVRYEIS